MITRYIMFKYMPKLVSGISCRHHGTRCIVSNMNNGRDATITNQIINEANRQKLELRIIELENIVKRLSEKVNKIEKNFNTAQDCKHAN